MRCVSSVSVRQHLCERGSGWFWRGRRSAASHQGGGGGVFAAQFDRLSREAEWLMAGSWTARQVVAGPCWSSRPVLAPPTPAAETSPFRAAVGCSVLIVMCGAWPRARGAGDRFSSSSWGAAGCCASVMRSRSLQHATVWQARCGAQQNKAPEIAFLITAYPVTIRLAGLECL